MLIFLYIVFVVLSFLLGLIVLLQEGKGGGMGAAFGGVGGEAFGHGAGGINRVTTVLATIYLLTAVVIAIVSKPASVL